MNKKYYWLKLKENFFEEDTISWIEEQEKGVYYINFYLKLCLKAMNSEGKLIRKVGEMLIPYDVKALAKMTGVEQDTVVVAMEVLKNTGLIEILENGEIYLTQLNDMIGSETKWAEKKRIQRSKKEEGHIEDNVPLLSGQSPIRDKRKEKDIDIDKDIYIEQPSPSASNSTKTTKESKHKYGEFKHVLLTDKEKDKLLSELGEHKFNLVIKRLDEYIEETGKKYKNHNLTIRRWVIDAVTKENPQVQSSRTNKDDGSSVIFNPRRDLPGYWSEDDDDDPSLVIFDPTRDL